MDAYIKLIILLVIWILFYKLSYIEHYDNIKPVDKNILSILSRIDIILADNNINYWAIGGTLLGLIRHKNIIPWDDDGDIGISNLDENKLLLLRQQFEQYHLGLTTFIGGYKIFDLNGKTIEQSWKYPFVDVFIYEKTDDIYKLNNTYSKNKWPNDYFKEDELFPLRRSKFGEIIINGINNAYPYLNRLYGHGWQVFAYKGYDHEHETNSADSKEFVIVNRINKVIPYLWVYWENLNGSTTPGYIELCRKTIFKHCYDSFVIIELNEKNISRFLPNIKKDLDGLIIQQKVDYYRVLLLSKYGGMYMDSDIIVMRDPIEIITNLDDFDYVGFGCTGDKCTMGCTSLVGNNYKNGCYNGKPSNWIMASRRNGTLINNILINMEEKIKDKKKFNYFDLGKFIIWDELNKLSDYKYLHYPNLIDGTRDKDGNWITTDYFFSNKQINYPDYDNLMFVVLYNSGMDHLKKLSEHELLIQDTNFSKFIKKSLSN